jgi:FkbM family methyltransferase
MDLATRPYAEGITAYFRPNTSDICVLTEVIEQRIYRRARIDFDVKKGERWLDLGANIGAFAVYCRIKGATAVCYEPDSDCFEILKLNAPRFKIHPFAVTANYDEMIPFWKGKVSSNYSKATCIPSPNLPKHPAEYLQNVHASALVERSFDGVKMDIEGSEGELIDQWLLPKCNKLCMEYHSSRDKSIKNLERRLGILKEKFKIVDYPPEFDRIIQANENDSYGGSQLTYYDRMIFCKDPR